MLKNFKLTIEYDGSAYHGWQRQKSEQTIQGEIEKAIITMTGQQVNLTGSGRTDAGVHAFGQTANFHCNTELTPEAFQGGLNSLLQDDIVIKESIPVDDTFHARYNAKSKTYRYHILNRRIPSAICRRYAWYIRKKLDIGSMQSAINHLIGTHDFKAFEGTGSPRSHTTRSVIEATLSEGDENRIVFMIKADGFLKFMVRNIVGTLVDVGFNKITPDDFVKILLSKDRIQASATAPPHGLFLMRVDY